MKRIILVLILLVGGCFYFITDNNDYSNDYYDNVNKKFLASNHLVDDKYIYNTFVVAQDESDKVRDNIVNEIISGKIQVNGVDDKIKTLYNNALDWNTRNNISTGPLDKYIDYVNNSKNIDELINNVVVIENELSLDIFSRIEVSKDFVDNKKNIVYLYPVTFAFGASADYFIDEDYMAYKAYLKRAIINILEKYGMSKGEARIVSSEVVSFYTDISSKSKLASSYEEVTSYYNIVDNNSLKDIYTRFDMVKYLNDRGINKEEYSLVDVGQYKAIDKYLTDEYLEVWKKVILVKILSSYASYLDMEYRDIVIDLNNSLTGSKEKIELKEDAVNLVSGVFVDEIDVIYEGKVISDKDKKYFYDMFDDIKLKFKDILSDNEWLSNETKEYAKLKLDNMKVYVGLDGYDSLGDDNINFVGNNLIENVISINRESYLYKLELLDSEIVVRALSETEVNAYYNPTDNAVYIPSSVMFLLKENDSYYERLGTIGMIIAHEITHGFDYNGSLFDKDGNLKNWWNDNDRSNYKKLKDKVSAYYNKVEVLDGKTIDGDKTVNENIADMGALKIISAVAVDKKASREEVKEMYLSFAKFWRCQATDEYTKLLLLNDSHSPNKYRVNVVLSLLDNFYEVYNIYPWNDMYVFKRNRINVW